MSERVLVFAPHAGIWVHAFPEALVADAIRHAGGEVVYVTCGGAFRSFCVVMAARRLTAQNPAADKAKVCKACQRNRNSLRDGIGFSGYDLDTALTDADERELAALLGHVTREALVDFTVDGVKVGRAALYEYLIARKRSHGDLDETEWHDFQPHLANVLRSFLAARRVFDRERPTRLVAYNTLYSVNAVWRAVADARGIPVFALHGGLSLAKRLTTLMIGRDSTLAMIYRWMDAWPAHADVPANRAELAAVTDHFCEVMRGTNMFSYSAPKAGEPTDWRARFKIRPHQKLLVATMSSYDEYVAARTVGEQPPETGLAFATQIEWIRALVAWMRGQPERFLLLRVHPREFPNKREGVKSQHAQMLERELVSLPDNVAVNWPADKLSLYDIAEHADLVLNAWSSAGKEMALLGRPVVVYCPTLLNYAPAINYVGETPAAYFAAIETALAVGWSFEHVRKAYRWCAVEYVRAIADIGDGFDYSEARATTLLGKARSAAFAIPNVRRVYDLLRKPRVLIEQARIAELILSGKSTLLDVPLPRAVATEAEETAALREQLGRLVAALYRNARGAPEPGSLRAHLTAASLAT